MNASSASSPRIAAVVLAAGLSRRMGTSKALLPLGDKPLLVHVIEAIVSAGGIEPIVVVTGHQADEIAKILRPLPVHPVRNPAYATGGMLSSIQSGVAAVAGKADAFFIVLGDQPMVRPETLRQMADAWRDSHPRVLLPAHGGKHGHPILLAAAGAEEIRSLPADATLKSYTTKYSEHTLELAIDDPAILCDIDTPADYQAAAQRFAGPHVPGTGRSPTCSED
jgi:molybdenum cofactor cytidylyltransferase